MSSAQSEPRWLFLVKPRWLAWHAFAVIAFIGMLWLGDWQFHRAESGNALSWAYTFEWPIFAVLGAVFWAKTIIDEWQGPEGLARRAAKKAARQAQRAAAASLTDSPHALALPGAADAARVSDDAEPEDPELTAYNAYLAKLSREVRGHGKWHGLR